MPSSIIVACHKLLKDQQLTLAFAESASGGRLCAEFSLIPECGQILKGGLVCYDAGIKQDILGVPKEVIEEFTPESAEVTKEIAERLGDFIKADILVGITGLTMAGGSETADKPVGTMFIHAIIKGKPCAEKVIYKGSPEEIVLQTIDRVGQMIIDELS